MGYGFEEEEKPEMDFVNACTVASLSQIYEVYAWRPTEVFDASTVRYQRP